MLETKSASPDDLAGAFDGFMRAFEAFKDGNDERLLDIVAVLDAGSDSSRRDRLHCLCEERHL